MGGGNRLDVGSNVIFSTRRGGGFCGFGGDTNGAVNTLTNEFLYTNLNNTI